MEPVPAAAGTMWRASAAGAEVRTDSGLVPSGVRVHTSLYAMHPLPAKPEALRWLPLLVAAAFFMQLLDATILNTAIPSIAQSFACDPLQLHSLVTAYMLTVCVLIPASGWVSDRFGMRRTFLTAIFLFTLGSLLCALSTSVEMMTACRVVQGIGGAFLMPVGRLAILRSYPRWMFVKVMNFVTIPGLLGPLLGPVLGGILVQYATWHWIFLINIPVGIAGFWATRRFMPDLHAVKAQKFDWKGFLLFSGSAVLLSVSLESAHGMPDKLHMAVLGSAGVLLQLLYWLFACRSGAPLFSPALFRIRNFAIGIAGNLVCRLGGSCLPYLMPLFFQVALGFSAFKSGLFLLPLALSNLLAKTVATRLIKTLGYRAIMILNTVTIGAMLVCFAFITQSSDDLTLLALLAVLGAANSVQFTCMNTLTLIDLPDEYASSGNSLLSMIMQLSIAISIAAASLLLDALGGQDAGRGSDDVMAAFHATFVTIGCLCALSSLVFSRVDRNKGKGGIRRSASPEQADGTGPEEA